MKGSFTASGAALVSAVHYVAKWIDAKPANPVLGGLVFTAGDGGQLTITSQGELATARSFLDVEGDAIGSFIVSGRLIDALVSTLTDKPVTFEQTDSLITMRAGRYTSELPAMSEKDYPSIALPVQSIGTVEGAALVDVARRVGAVASRDTTNRIAMTGIQFSFAGEINPPSALTLAATDSKRACRETLEWSPSDDCPREGSFVIPASVMLDAGDAFAGLEEAEIGWVDHAVSLRTSTRSLVTRTLGKPEDYPPIGGLFEQIDKRTETVVLSVKDVMVPLKRADQLAATEYRHVELDLRENCLVLRSSTEGKGNGGEEIDVEYSGPPCTIITRSAILHGVLGTAPGDTVTLHLTPASYQSVFATSPANPAWSHLFMPIRHV